MARKGTGSAPASPEPEPGSEEKVRRAQDAQEAFVQSFQKAIDREKRKAWEQSIRDKFPGRRSADQARATIRSFCRTGKPFMLFLRNFEQEAYDYSKPPTDQDPQARLWGVMGGASKVEEKLARGLVGEIRVVAVANPSDLIMAEGSFPRLELFDEPWLQVVEWLVQAAAFIVVDLDALAPGMLAELDAVAKHGRQQSTVVVLPPRHGPDPSDTASLSLLEAMGAQIPKYERPYPAHPSLAGFSRVVHEDELPRTLRSSPLFADLLEAYKQQDRTKPKPDAKLTARRARLANEWGELRLAAGDVHEAMDTFVAAVPMFFQAGDPLGQAGVLLNIGRTYMEIGQYEDAIQAFRHGGATSKKYGDDAGFWLAAILVAIAYFLLGERETAAGYLLAVLDPIRAAGETGLLAEALRALQRIYQAAGDEEAARRYQEELQAVVAQERGVDLPWAQRRWSW